MAVRWLFVLLVVVGMPSHAVEMAGIDGRNLELAERYPVPLRWDNIEGRPYWVGGEAPQGVQERHVIRLAPGQDSVFRLPAGSRLRLDRAGGDLPGSVRVAFARADGLWVPRIGQDVANARARIYSPPSRARHRVRVRLAESAAGPVVLAAFRSRATPRQGPAEAHSSLPPPARGEALRLRPDQDPDHTDSWRLGARTTANLEVQGPTTLELALRWLPEIGGSSQARQATLRVALNDGAWRRHALDLQLDPTPPTRIEGCVRPLGREQTIQVHIPEGHHRLRIRPEVALLVRAQHLGRGEYLSPKSNAAWLDESRTPHETTAERARAAGRLALRADRREPALTSLARLKTSSSPHQPRLNAARQKIENRQTFFRYLTPNAPSGVDTASLRYVTRSFRALGTPQRPRRLAPWLGPHRPLPLPEAPFTQVPANPSEALTFRVPPRGAPSQLRIAVTDEPGPLKVQVGTQEPITLRPVEATDKGSDATRADTGLAAVAQHSMIGGDLGQAHAWALLDAAGSTGIVRARTADLSLPAGVRRVRVWSTSESPGARVALGYRSSRSPELNESQALTPHRTDLTEDLKAQLEAPRAWFVSLRGFRDTASMEQLAARLADAGWEAAQQVRRHTDGQWRYRVRVGPFTKRSRAHHARERLRAEEVGEREMVLERDRAAERKQKPVSPAYGRLVRELADGVQRLRTKVSTDTAKEDTISAAAAQQLRQRANTLTREGHWLPALEQWAQVADGVTGRDRHRARLRQALLLRRLDEPHLADRLLRGIALQADHDATRSAAAERLLRRERRRGNWLAVQQLSSALWVDTLDTRYAGALAQALVMRERPRAALLIASLTPSAVRDDVERLRYAAVRLGWWEVLDELLVDADEPTQAFWRGVEAARRGRFAAARRHWEAAGPRAQAWTETIERARHINQRLTATDRATRHDAIRSWLDWWVNQPGPWTWRDADSLVRGAAGGDRVHVAAGERWAGYYRATAEFPVRLRVQGPAQIRVRVRPLHGQGRHPERSDWLDISAVNGESWVLPIRRNRPSAGLTVSGDQHRPGRQVSGVLRLGSGTHELRVRPRSGPVLIDVDRRRPVAEMALLPEPTPAAMHAAITGRWSKRSSMDASSSPRSVAGRSNVWRAVEDCELRALAIPQGDPIPDPATTDWRRLGERLHIGPLPSGPALPTYSTRLAPALSTRFEPTREGLDSPSRDGLSIEQALIRLLAWADANPDQRDKAVARAWSLTGRQPNLAQHNLLAAIEQGTSWQRLQGVVASAGLRRVDAAGLPPIQPYTRTRTALLSGKPPRLLAGDDALALRVDVARPGRLLMDLEPLRLPYQRPHAPRIQYRHEGESGRSRLLPDGQRTQVTVPLRGGSNSVRLRLATPYANRYVGLWPTARSAGRNVAFETRPDRNYQLATSEQPIEAVVRGPIRLRIDRLRDDGEVTIEYRLLSEGIQRLQVEPEPHQSEILVRIYARRPAPRDRDPLPLLAQPTRSTSLPWPGVANPRADEDTDALIGVKASTEADAARQVDTEGAALGSMQVRDAYRLGAQEDGTSHFSGSWIQRDRASGEPTGSRSTDRFLELTGGRRWRLPERRVYWRAEGSLRIRPEAPTLGLAVRRLSDPANTPWRWWLGTRNFAQRLEGTGPDWGTHAMLRGAASWRARWGQRWQYRATLGGFTRWLSLKPDEASRASDLDRDVFTEYKEDHRQGLELGQRLSYRPTRDARASLEASMLTNEALNPGDPDRFRVDADWDQRLGRWRMGVGYRWEHFFDDADRTDRTDQSSLRLDLGWERWQADGGRRFAGLGLRYDRNDQDATVQLTLGTTWGAGRLLRDFAPDEQLFRDLREWRGVRETVDNEVNRPPR